MISYHLKSKAKAGPSRRLAKAAMCILAECLSDENLLHELELTLTEACANVVRHAYPDGQTGDIEVVLVVEPQHFVEIEVVDQGVGCPECARRLANPGPMAESGRGLYIMTRLADSVDIVKRGRDNIVAIRKQVERSQWKDCA